MHLTKWITILCFSAMTAPLIAQTSSVQKQRIAVMNIETSDIPQSPALVGKLALLNMQTKSSFEAMREYDVAEMCSANKIDVSRCMSVTCLSDAGKLLNVDLVLSGSVERMGELIIMNLVLVDVQKRTIVASTVRRFYNLSDQMEGMMTIAINDLIQMPNDPVLVNALVKKDEVIEEQIVEKLKLNGPRMGVMYVGGTVGRKLQIHRSDGGYEMYPVMSQWGYQFEKQYLSAGNIQALVEFVPMVSGLEQGRFVPSMSFLNGFRHSRSGLEFAFGPSFRIVREATGYYTPNGIWHLEEEWNERDQDNRLKDNPYTIIREFDSRGRLVIGYSFIVAAGKTFHSGHLNIPMNVYFATIKKGFSVGMTMGFNVRKK